jgi:hypothetical protein
MSPVVCPGGWPGPQQHAGGSIPPVSCADDTRAGDLGNTVVVSADPGEGGIPAAAVRVDRESAGWNRLLADTGPGREAAPARLDETGTA